MQISLIQMEWRNLLFVSRPVQPGDLKDHLPQGLDLDLYGGEAWVSLVAFENRAIRLRGAPRFLGVDLPELNLRTYVKKDGMPGVWFLSLDADGLMSVLGARLGFALPYHRARIRMESHDGGYRFESERRHPGETRASFAATYRPVGDEQAPRPGSLDHFLLERYRLYAKTPLGLARVEVRHEPWAVQRVEAQITHDSILQAAGLPQPTGEPVYHYAAGREVVGSPLLKA